MFKYLTPFLLIASLSACQAKTVPEPADAIKFNTDGPALLLVRMGHGLTSIGMDNMEACLEMGNAILVQKLPSTYTKATCFYVERVKE